MTSSEQSLGGDPSIEQLKTGSASPRAHKTACCAGPQAHTTSPDSPKYRRNGCHPPFLPKQVAAVIMFFILVICFHLIAIACILWAPVRYALIAAHGLCAITAVYYNVITSKIDPSDPNVIDKSKAKKTGYHCNQCDCQVLPDSRHCKTCNRCVERFDHHCVWLGNCIGVRNYKPFVRLLVATTSMLVLECACGIVAISGSFAKERNVLRRLPPSHQATLPSLRAVQSLIILFTILAIIALYFVGQLLLFHMILMRGNLSTYEYIMKERYRRLQDDMNCEYDPEANTSPPTKDTSTTSSHVPHKTHLDDPIATTSESASTTPVSTRRIGSAFRSLSDRLFRRSPKGNKIVPTVSVNMGAKKVNRRLRVKVNACDLINFLKARGGDVRPTAVDLTPGLAAPAGPAVTSSPGPTSTYSVSPSDKANRGEHLRLILETTKEEDEEEEGVARTVTLDASPTPLGTPAAGAPPAGFRDTQRASPSGYATPNEIHYTSSKTVALQVTPLYPPPHPTSSSGAPSSSMNDSAYTSRPGQQRKFSTDSVQPPPPPPPPPPTLQPSGSLTRRPSARADETGPVPPPLPPRASSVKLEDGTAPGPRTPPAPSLLRKLSANATAVSPAPPLPPLPPSSMPRQSAGLLPPLPTAAMPPPQAAGSPRVSTMGPLGLPHNSNAAPRDEMRVSPGLMFPPLRSSGTNSNGNAAPSSKSLQIQMSRCETEDLNEVEPSSSIHRQTSIRSPMTSVIPGCDLLGYQPHLLRKYANASRSGSRRSSIAKESRSNVPTNDGEAVPSSHGSQTHHRIKVQHSNRNSMSRTGAPYLSPTAQQHQQYHTPRVLSKTGYPRPIRESLQESKKFWDPQLSHLHGVEGNSRSADVSVEHQPRRDSMKAHISISPVISVTTYAKEITESMEEADVQGLVPVGKRRRPSFLSRLFTCFAAA